MLQLRREDSPSDRMVALTLMFQGVKKTHGGQIGKGNKTLRAQRICNQVLGKGSLILFTNLK